MKPNPIKRVSMFMISAALVMIVFAMTFVRVGVANAQQAKEVPIHPGQTIKLEVKFGGPDAGAFNQVYPRLNLIGDVPSNQTGFARNIEGKCTKNGSDKFDCDFPVSDGAPTGDYGLSLDTRGDGIQINYESGKQFQLQPIRIENPRTFTVPSVTVKER